MRRTLKFRWYDVVVGTVALAAGLYIGNIKYQSTFSYPLSTSDRNGIYEGIVIYGGGYGFLLGASGLILSRLFVASGDDKGPSPTFEELHHVEQFIKRKRIINELDSGTLSSLMVAITNYKEELEGK